MCLKNDLIKDSIIKGLLDFGIIVRAFANGPEDLGSIQRFKKWYLIPPCLTLSIIRYRSNVKWSNPGKRVVPATHLGVVAIEKGTFESLSTSVTNFTYFYLLLSKAKCFNFFFQIFCS